MIQIFVWGKNALHPFSFSAFTVREYLLLTFNVVENHNFGFKKADFPVFCILYIFFYVSPLAAANGYSFWGPNKIEAVIYKTKQHITQYVITHHF